MKNKNIFEICNPKQWKTISTSKLKDDGFPVYGANGIIGYYDEYNHEEPTVLITCRGATCGEIHISKPMSYINGNAMALDNLSDEVDINYLYYYLLSYDFNSIISGSAQPQITRQGLKKLDVRYPPLETQKKIVEVLDKAQGLIDARKEQIRLMDELVQSVFYEMFGDPVKNPKGWEKNTIGSVVKSITAGWSANGEARIRNQGEKAVLKVSSVTQGYFKEDEYKVINKNQEIKKYVFPEKGDLLFSRANTREMVGATCVIDKDYPDLLLPDKLWKVLFTKKAEVYYMKYILTHPSVRAEFSAMSTGTSGSMYNVSMVKFKNIVVPIPPKEKQNQFAQFVQLMDKKKIEMEKSFEEIQLSYQALMQKSFKGDLFGGE